VRCCYTAATLPSITADFWVQLRALVAFLEPFRIATDALQTDTATLLTVYEQFVLLQRHVHHENQWAADSILARWNKLINVPAVTACAVLSFVQLPPALSLAKAQQFILNWGTKYLHYYHLVHESFSRRDIRDTLTEQLAEFQGRLGEFAGLDEIKQSLQRKATALKPFQARKVWLLHSQLELSRVATALLTLAPSEASVERSFSAQGSVHTKLRNRMADRSVQDEMFIKFNSRELLKPPPCNCSLTASTSDVPQPLSKCVELSPNSDEELSISDSEDAFLFGRRRGHAAAASFHAAAAVVDEEIATDVDDADEFQNAEEETKESEGAAAAHAAPAAAAAPAPSGAAARRAARRAVSIVFKDVDAFLAWFIQTRQLHASSIINADVHNDLQQNSQSKLPIANAPSTKELCNRIRLLLQPQPSGAAAAAAAGAAECS
jgi:hypothetical protein